MISAGPRRVVEDLVSGLIVGTSGLLSVRRPRRPRFPSRKPVDDRAALGSTTVNRGHRGSKHHLIVDAHGIPPAITLTGCNRHDVTQLLPLLDAVPPIRGSSCTAGPPPHGPGSTRFTALPLSGSRGGTGHARTTDAPLDTAVLDEVDLAALAAAFARNGFAGRRPATSTTPRTVPSRHVRRGTGASTCQRWSSARRTTRWQTRHHRCCRAHATLTPVTGWRWSSPKRSTPR